MSAVAVLLAPTAGCSQQDAPSEQSVADQYVAAAVADDLGALRALMAYQPDGDPHSLVAGSRVPLPCVKVEATTLHRLPIAVGLHARVTQVAPALPGAEGAKLDVMFIRLRDGTEVGRELIHLASGWHVLAQANNECNHLFS